MNHQCPPNGHSRSSPHRPAHGKKTFVHYTPQLTPATGPITKLMKPAPKHTDQYHIHRYIGVADLSPTRTTTRQLKLLPVKHRLCVLRLQNHLNTRNRLINIH